MPSEQSDMRQKVNEIPDTVKRRINHVCTGHPPADPIALIVSSHAMVAQVAVARGIIPDRPRHFGKVTETL